MRCLALRFFSSSVSVLYVHPVSFVVPSSSFRNSTQHICLPQESVSNVCRRFLFCRDNSGGELNFSLAVSRALSFPSLRGTSSLTCNFRIRLDSGDAVSAKVGTNCLNTLQSRRSNRYWITVVGISDFQMASSV